MRRAIGTPFAFLFMLLVGMGGCNILEPEIADSGVVKKLEIEGGCWVIESDPETYLPANFPTDLRVEDLRVQFEASSRTGLASVCPGRQIDLIWIEAVTPDGSGSS